MRTLVISEKPSVAISISKVLGATKKKDGYYEGNGYKVSWCVGHLIQMANPDSYDEKYAKWNIEDLPIIPSEYKYEIMKPTKKQFVILKKLKPQDRQERIIHIMKDTKNITALELSKLLFVSVSTIERDLKKLTDENMIEYVGSAKDGYWRVNK